MDTLVRMPGHIQSALLLQRKAASTFIAVIITAWLPLPLRAQILEAKRNYNGQTISVSDQSHLKEHSSQILDDLTSKIKKDPDNGENYFRRAFIYYQLLDYKKALKDCQRANKLGVDHASLHLLTGEALFAQKKYAEALAEVNQAIDRNKNIARAYALTAEIQSALKEYAKALQNCNTAIELDPNNAHYYEIRADLAYKVEQYLRSIKDATKAIRLNPNSKNAYTLRSKAEFAVNDQKQAEIDAQKAKELSE